MDKLMAMQVFVATVDSGSQSAAAEKLGMSRPVVSRYLVELEDWSGARLLHRTTRKLSLTAAGTDVYARSRELLELSQQMRQAVGEAGDTPRGRLRITASTTLGRSVLARLLAQFAAQYPAVSIDILLSDQLVDLVEQRIDLAVRITNSPGANMVARKLATCHVLLCAAPVYIGQHGAPQHPAQLRDHNCLTHATYGKNTWTFSKDGEQHEITVSGNISANDASAIEQTAICGAGLAMLPAYMALPLIAKGELVALLPGYEAMSMTIYAIYATRRNMPLALARLVDFLELRFRQEQL